MGTESQPYGTFEASIRAHDEDGLSPALRVMYDWQFEQYAPHNYQTSGFFRQARPPVDFKRFEAFTLFAPFNGVMYHGVSKPNPSKSLFSSYDVARDDLDYLDCIRLKDLASFETVNAQQWLGNPHIEHRVGQAQTVVWREGSCWDIATADTAMGTRRIMLRGHVARDYAFVIQQRLQAVADYTRSLMLGWEHIADIYARNSIEDPEGLQPEFREEGDEYAQVLNQRISENMPDWPWLSR